MPGFDGTGPLGEGAMTGGGFGYCGTGRRSGYGLPGRAFYRRFGGGWGRGFGRGRWFGRGVGPAYGKPWGPYVEPRALDAKTELVELQREANDLKAYLNDVEARIAELGKASEQ